MPIDAETERRRLARPVRYQSGVEVAVLSLEELGLEARKGTPDSQVELLSRINRLGLVFVRLAQRVHCRPNVLVGDGGKLCAVDLLLTSGRSPHDRQYGIHDLKANVLALFVAVEPEDEELCVLGLAGEEGRHLELWRRLLLLRIA